MIVGLGLDIVELPRVRGSLERFGPAFLNRLLHPEERAGMPGGEARGENGQLEEPSARAPGARLVAWTAARFAAKEAASKALGTGFSGGIGLHDVRILSLPSGKPEIFLHGKAAEAAVRLGAARAHLSLTHGRDTAAAVVVLESDSARPDARPDVREIPSRFVP